MSSMQPARRRRPRTVGRPTGDSVGEQPIITATVELLKTTHPARLNRSDVARAANVDPALIRYYFGDMDRLLMRTAYEITEEIVAAIERMGRESISDGETALAGFVHGFFDSVTRFPNYHQLLLQQIFYARSREGRAYRKKLQVAGQTRLRAIIDFGVAAGVFQPVDTRYLEVAILGMCETMITSWPLVEDLFDRSASRAETAAEYCNFITDVVLAYATNRAAAPPEPRARLARSARAAKKPATGRITSKK